MRVDAFLGSRFPSCCFGVMLLAAALVSCARDANLAAEAPGGRIGPGDHNLGLTVKGLKRTYLLHVPPSLKPDLPAPLVFLFHGAYGNGKAEQKMAKMDPIADREGFINVYPDGLGRAWNSGDCCGRPQKQGISDVEFVRALIKELSGRLSIDRRRIYAAGMSNGAMFVHKLGCDLSDEIAALGSVSGTIREADCKPKRPVPIISFHGTADERLPWNGGPGQNPAAGIHTSVPKTIKGWEDRNGCEGKPAVVLKKGDVTCESYAPCKDDADVILCTIQGGGHQWPGGEPFWESKLGHMSTDVSASEEMWKFFKAHPMTGGGGGK